MSDSVGGPQSEPHEAPTALIILDQGKAQSVLRCLVSLVFNYRYGLRTEEVDSFEEALEWLGGGERDLRCVVLIQKHKLTTGEGISAFNLHDNPLFALVPKALTADYLQADGKTAERPCGGLGERLP